MARKPAPSHHLPLRLTPIQRRVLYLRLEQELSFAQIAARMGWKQKSTAYQHYLYGVEKAKRIKRIEARKQEGSHELARAGV